MQEKNSEEVSGKVCIIEVLWHMVLSCCMWYWKLSFALEKVSC